MFDLSLYKGTYTTDLFGDDEATFFDDVDEFHRLQRQAVDELADTHRKRADFVDVFNGYSVPWWQYRTADKGQKRGVVIDLSPNGAVEIRKGLMKNMPDDDDADRSAEAEQSRPRPEFGPSLLAYFAHHKTIALMGALAEQPRKMLEVAAALLLSGFRTGNRIRIDQMSSERVRFSSLYAISILPAIWGGRSAGILRFGGNAAKAIAVALNQHGSEPWL